MSFNVSPRALRFSDASAELAEFEVKRGLMRWVSEKTGTVKGLLEYANMVCAAGDSLFGEADMNVVDFVHHTMQMYDSSCWSDTTVGIVGDYLVAAPADTDLYLYEKGIRETAMGDGFWFDCSLKSKPQCPVCLWQGKVRRHCSVCWSRSGAVTMALLSVDFPFYIADDMVGFVQALGLGNVIRSVDGITRWWVKLDVATYFKVSDHTTLEDCLVGYSARRQGLARVATGLFDAGCVKLTSSPSVSALTALVDAEGERVGPLVFAMSLAQHLGVNSTKIPAGAYSVFSSQTEALNATKGASGARMESLSLLAQVQLTAGSSYSRPMLPSRSERFLTAGYFSGMELTETSKYLFTVGLKLVATVRELSVERLDSGLKVKAGGSKRKSVQGLSPMLAQFPDRLTTDVRALSPSEASEASWSGRGSPASSVTTFSSVSGSRDSVSLDAMTVTSYVPPHVQSVTESTTDFVVTGHVADDDTVTYVELAGRKTIHDSLFDCIKYTSHAADYVEQTAVRPWYDGSVKQGEGGQRMMPYALDVFASAVDSVGVASMALGALRSKLQNGCLENVPYYVSMGAVVDVVLMSTADRPSSTDYGSDVVIRLSARAPSVDPITREAFEVASESYRLLPEAFEGLPSLKDVAEEHVAELSTGWLLCRYSPTVLSAKRHLKLRTIDVNQLFNNTQLQVQSKLSQHVLGVVSDMMGRGLNVEAGAMLCWTLNLHSDKSYKLVWDNMAHAFEKLELSMVTTKDVDKSNEVYNLEYQHGCYSCSYGKYTLESDKPSVLLRALRGMAISEERGSECFDFYVASLKSEKSIALVELGQDMAF